MKRLGFFLLFLSISLMLCSLPLKEEQIVQAAKNWFNAQTGLNSKIMNLYPVTNDDNQTQLLMVDFDPQGFVIMSADNTISPVLAYSSENQIIDHLNPSQKALLEELKNQINYSLTQKLKNQEATNEWNLLINNKIRKSKQIKNIEMEVDWNQDGIYNAFCPLVNGTRCYVGCGATAIVQIINYHKYFNHTFNAQDQYSYVHYIDPIAIQIDQNAQIYSFPDFTTLNGYMATVSNSYQSGNPYLSSTQKGHISFATAVLCKMSFGHTGSSSSSDEYVNTYAKTGYSSKLLDRNGSGAIWESLIQSNINNNLPVLYIGTTDEEDPHSGHAFILKGYNFTDPNNHLYCVNWGWGSYYANQWWSLNALGPQNEQFNYRQRMVYDIKPLCQVNFTTNLSTGLFSGSAIIEMINKNTNLKQVYYSSGSTLQVPNIEAHVPYDINIFHSSGDYEWYQAENVVFNTGQNNQVALLKHNPDKLIEVPTDYPTLNQAFSKIQDGGSIRLLCGNYTGTGWKYKHIKLYSDEAYAIIDELILKDSLIDNRDILENLRFNEANIVGQLKLLNGASPTIKKCHFNEHNVRLNNSNPINQKEYMGLGVYVEGIAGQTNQPLFIECLFKNNTFKGGDGGAAVGLNGGAVFKSCTFSNNTVTTNDTEQFNGIMGGGAVFVYSDVCPTSILFDGCSFTYNQSQNFAKDIFVLRADQTKSIDIKNCTFTGTENNSLMQKPAIQLFSADYDQDDDPFYYSTCDISIQNNQFKNLNSTGIKYVEKFKATSLSVTQNLFYKFETYRSIISALDFSANGNSSELPNLTQKSSSVVNNTFKNIQGYGINTNGTNLVRVINNIFENCDITALNLNGSTPHIEYNFFYSAGDFSGNNNIVSNFTNLNTFTFTPIWSAQDKSICIDNGKPDLDEDGQDWLTDSDDRDADGTRKDIGAIYYPHGTMIHNFSQSEDKERIYWISFPYLDKLYSTTTYFDVDKLYYILNDYENNNLLNSQNPFIENMEWIYSGYKKLSYESDTWVNSNETVDSRIGYKLKLSEGSKSEFLVSSGFLCGTIGNNDKKLSIKACQSQPYTEQWIGYFNPKSQDPLIALAEIAGDLIEIKTQNWSINRTDKTKNWNIPNRKPLINQGEAVSIRYTGTRDKDFNWYTSSDTTSTMPYSEPYPEYYSFNEKADYIPLFVVLDTAMKKKCKSNSEIAFYINGVCYGAEVVYGDTVQINAFICDLPDSLNNVEFRFHTSEMGNTDQKITEYAVYNFTREKYEIVPLNLLEQKQFYRVSLNSDDFIDHTLPAKSRLVGNYPNPFNPSTKIKYAIVEDSDVKIQIFNVKGQFVKELVNTHQVADHYEIDWNGKNQAGQRVSSGLYFYKLSTKNVKETKKMLLVK